MQWFTEQIRGITENKYRKFSWVSEQIIVLQESPVTQHPINYLTPSKSAYKLPGSLIPVRIEEYDEFKVFSDFTFRKNWLQRTPELSKQACRVCLTLSRCNSNHTSNFVSSSEKGVTSMSSALEIFDIVQTLSICACLVLTFPCAFFVYFKLIFFKAFSNNYTFKLIVLNGLLVRNSCCLNLWIHFFRSC